MERQLTSMQQGDKIKVVSFNSGRLMKERLISMGLHIGAEIEIVQKDLSGPYIIAVKECRLAIGQGMAQKIMVE